MIHKYKDTRALGTTYLNQLFSLKPAGSSPMQLDKLIDKYAALIAALKQLKIPDLSEFIFVYMGLKLLDVETAKAYEMSIRGTSSMPNYDDFVSFIREQVKILYRTSQRSASSPSAGNINGRFNGQVTSGGGAVKTRSFSTRTPQSYVSAQSDTLLSGSCALCRDSSHTHLHSCKRFLELNPYDRFKCAKENRACTNCLSTQHNLPNCNSRTTCHKCNSKHHTLLHFGNNHTSTAQSQVVPQPSMAAVAIDNDCGSVVIADEIVPGPGLDPEISLCSLSSAKCKSSTNYIKTTEVLATAKAIATARDGRDVLIRCILDPGSQKNIYYGEMLQQVGIESQSRSHLVS